jgi:hypothetical protein
MPSLQQLAQLLHIPTTSSHNQHDSRSRWIALTLPALPLHLLISLATVAWENTAPLCSTPTHLDWLAVLSARSPFPPPTLTWPSRNPQTIVQQRRRRTPTPSTFVPSAARLRPTQHGVPPLVMPIATLTQAALHVWKVCCVLSTCIHGLCAYTCRQRK